MITFANQSATDAGVLVAASLSAVSNLALLWPAVLAARFRQPIIATSLAGAALLTLLCAFNDAGDVVGSPILAGVLHVCLHLSVVQVALALLGPTDPDIDPPASVLGSTRPVPQIQLHSFVMLLGVVSVLAAEWATRHVWAQQDFQRICVLVDQALIGAGFGFFWFSSARRCAAASQVLLRGRFWQRILFLALPLLALVLVAAMRSAIPASPVWQATLRIVAATVAAAAIWITFATTRLELDTSVASNRPVAHWLLFSCAAIFAPAVLCTLAGDTLERSWRWATLSMAASSQIGSFVLTVAALPLVAVTLLSVSLIESVPPARSPPTGIIAAAGVQLSTLKTLHGAAMHFARLGMVFGLAAAVFTETDKIGRTLHTGSAIMMFCSFWAVILLSTIGSDLTTRFGKARVAIAACILIGMVNHLALFLFANEFIPTHYGVPRALSMAYFLSEYAMLGLLVAYPITWFDDVRRWQNPHNEEERLVCQRDLVGSMMRVPKTQEK